MITIGVMDVETSMLTHGERPRTKFWGLGIEGEPYHRFETSHEFARFVTNYPKPLRLFHHHDFDILQLMVDGVYPKIHAVRSGRVIDASLGGVQLRNSYALFPTKLAEILDAAGYQKKELDDLDARNYGDTVEALDALEQISRHYFDLWGVDALRGKHLTAASCAFTACEALAGKLPVCLTDRDAYRGGRVECFQVGDCGEAESYDINSSYPFSFVDAPESSELIWAHVSHGEEISPWFDRNSTDKLLFPRGHYETAFFSDVYERYIRPHVGAHTLRITRRVRVDLSWLRRVGVLLSDAYAMRQRAKATGNGALAYSVKIGINASYGRLGMRPSRQIAQYRDAGRKPSSWDDFTSYKLPDGQEIVFREVKSRPRANYHYAAYITDNARGRLFDGLRRAVDPFYCDTDSVKCRKLGENPPETGEELGQWKFEGKETLRIESVKDYLSGSTIKRKGGSGGYQWTLKRLLMGKPVLNVPRIRRTTYNKRAVLPDGSTRALIASRRAPWKSETVEVAREKSTSKRSRKRS